MPNILWYHSFAYPPSSPIQGHTGGIKDPSSYNSRMSMLHSEKWLMDVGALFHQHWLGGRWMATKWSGPMRHRRRDASREKMQFIWYYFFLCFFERFVGRFLMFLWMGFWYFIFFYVFLSIFFLLLFFYCLLVFVFLWMRFFMGDAIF